MAFIKGKRLNYNKMTLRELIIAYFAHWTGYASNGWKTGISSNPTAARLDEYLFEHFPKTWAEGHYEENGVHTKLMHKVLDICDKAYSPPSNAPIYVRKQMEKAWPKVEKFLETTPLINDDEDREVSEAITFEELKNYMDESYDDHYDDFTQEGSVVINSLNKISNQLNKVLSSTKFGSKNFEQYVKTALDSIDNAKQSYMV